MLRHIRDHPYFLWVILALPSLPMIGAVLSGAVSPDGRSATEFLIHPTGEFSARFLIIAMILTPLRMLFPQSGFIRWMMKRRRYFGVAAFFYAAFHTLLYLIDMGSLRAIFGEFLALGIWTGWLAFAILGPAWKTLQRTVYVAAVATLLHWIFVHNNLGPALVHFLPLAALETYRVAKHFRTRPTPA